MDTFTFPFSADPSSLQQHSFDPLSFFDDPAPQQAGEEGAWDATEAVAVPSRASDDNHKAPGHSGLGQAPCLGFAATANEHQLALGPLYQHTHPTPPAFSFTTSPAELYPSALGFSAHRRHPSSASSASSSSLSIGPYKREPSIRRARADSIPYVHPHSQHAHAEQLELGEGAHVSEAFGRLTMASSGSSTGGVYPRRSSLSTGSWAPSEAGPAEGAEQEGASGEGLGALDLLELLKQASSDDVEEGGGHSCYEGGEGEAEDVRCMREAREQLDSATRKLQDATTTAAQDRAKYEFVQTWLSVSYSLDDDGTASRQGVYGSYVKECETRSLRAINAASFGKVIRSKWPQLKTRRLGSRSTSRYHYVGCKPAYSAELARMTQCDTKGHPDSSNPPSSGEDEASDLENEQLGAGPIKRLDFYQHPSAYYPDSNATLLASDRPSLFWTSSSAAAPSTPMTARPLTTHGEGAYLIHGSFGIPGDLSVSIPPGGPGAFGGETTLGGAASILISEPSAVMKEFPRIEEVVGGGGGGEGASVREFWTSYSTHSAGLLALIQARRFDQFEIAVRTWWATLTAEQVTLVTYPLVSQLIDRGASALYQNCLEVLHSEISAGMDHETFNSLRELANRLESTQRIALAPFDRTSFSASKIDLAARFGQLLKMHLGLSQLAQALGEVLKSAEKVQAMRDAWELIDLEGVKWKCKMLLDDALDMLDGLALLVKSDHPINIWSIIHWTEDWIETSLYHLAGSSPKQLLYSWSIASQGVIRDLTLRSDPAFGSIHILLSFIDELLSFKILRRNCLPPSDINTDLFTNYHQPAHDVATVFERPASPPSVSALLASGAFSSTLDNYPPFQGRHTILGDGQAPDPTLSNGGAAYQQPACAHPPPNLGVAEQRQSFGQDALNQRGGRDDRYEFPAWRDGGQ